MIYDQINWTADESHPAVSYIIYIIYSLTTIL